MNVLIVETNESNSNDIKRYYQSINLNVIAITSNCKNSINFINENKYNIDYIILNSKNNCNKDILCYLKKYNLNIKIVMNFINKEKEKQIMYFNYEIEIKISDILYNLGFSPKYIGYQYIKEILIQLNLKYNKNLEHYYNLISIKYNKNKKDIESSIRYAIDLSLARGNLNKIHSIFGYMVNDNKLRPSNKEFIYTIHDILK